MGIKDVTELVKKIAKGGDTVELGNDTKLTYRVKPKYSNLKHLAKKKASGDDAYNALLAETKFKLKVEHSVEDTVDLFVVVNGQPFKLDEQGVKHEPEFEAKFGATKRF